MSNEKSKQEYLKRYIEDSKDSVRKRKKKRKTNSNASRLKIVDENIDLKSISFGDKSEDELPDEAPVIAEVIDERPLEMREAESTRWRKIENVSQVDLSEASNMSMVNKPVQNSKRTRYDSDSDISPLRTQNERMKHKRRDSDSDVSPLKPQKVKLSSKRHDSGSDISPPRSQRDKVFSKRQGLNSDISPPRGKKETISSKRHDSDSDMSPPRGKRVGSRRQDSDSDISPPRGKREKIKSKRQDSDSDVSPPRNSKQNSNKKRRHSSNSDISPPRRVNQNNNNRHDSDSDMSPLHHKRSNISGRSDKRTHSAGWHKAKSSQFNEGKMQRSSRSSDSDSSPPCSKSAIEASYTEERKKPKKTLSGLKAGLQSSDILRKENQELRKREKIHLNKLDDSVSGRNADTIIRDRKTGLKRDLDQEKKVKDEEKKKEERNQQKYNEWGKGVEQTELRNNKVMEDLYEISKPLARYRDDEDLEEQLKSIIHEDDPMAEYIKKKKKKDVPNLPVYSGPPAPPNRFGIPPGYRWDGVDRSNGFERRYFEKVNKTKAVQEESYLWSVQDM